ncbi:UBP-type zinc finger domain-containing protein [Sphaerisporangium sp. NBC_01403]|uniref:UBP-type zinc finger domain-containing protein n=1 Tax=Sphaerisporangium TaxID=321315 RepID=UPI003252B4FB
MEAAVAQCSHVDQIRRVSATSDGCQECLALGQRWVHLRECLSCGHVGCCDSSRGRHATKHHRASGHPIAASAEPGETWAWCYVDEEVIEN